VGTGCDSTFHALHPKEIVMKYLHRLGAVALVLCVAPAWSGGKKPMSEAQQRFQQERAACMSGSSHQDRATCLKEAAAAHQEARRGGLSGGGSVDLSQNATGRCDAQPPAERQACIQRILGAGSASGSVEGGGVLRQSESQTR
jgi:hypothetical protein